MMQRTKVRQRPAGLFRSRILATFALAFLMVSQGGAAHQIRGGNNPRAVAATYPHSEPSRGYSSHAPYGEECKHCHAPVGCLAANRCPDCHLEVARAQECAETEDMTSMPPDTGTYQIARVEQPERDDAACDTPQATLNHEQLSSFSLDQHKTGFDGKPLACQSCHPEGLYDSDSVACAGCHAQEAPAYMADHAAEYGDGCVDCHDGQGGTAGLEEGEVHALGGKHKEAGCQECHTGSTFADEVLACSDCHKEPEAHAGQTGLRCDWCHTAVSWEPARLIEHSFRLDHGDLDEVGCEACHTGTYETYTCNGCHDHQSAELQERHAQEGIEQLEPCGRCHPTGLAGEAGKLGHGREGQPGNLEAPGVQSPASGPKVAPPGGTQTAPPGGTQTAPPGQEGGEQMGPADGMAGPKEPVEGVTEPVVSSAGSETSMTEPANCLAASEGSPEEPAESLTGSTGSLPEVQEPAPAVPSSSDEALAPDTQPGSQTAEK